MDHIDFRDDLEQFGGHVGHGANAGRSKVDLARIGFRMGNKFGDCLGRKRWVHHQDMRATGDTRDRCDIAEKNEIELVVECRVDYVGRTASEERVVCGLAWKRSSRQTPLRETGGQAVPGCGHAERSANGWDMLINPKLRVAELRWSYPFEQFFRSR